MSRYLFASAVYQTMEEATAQQGGTLWTRKDIPVGTILAYGTDGEWYKYDREPRIMKEEIPLPRDGKIQLFRDYWKIATLGINDKSAYTLSLISVLKKKVA